jgi:hypothetical protein
MKKFILSAFFVTALAVSGISQQVISSSGINNPNLGNFENEVKFNFLNLIVLGAFEVGYERFLSESHSLDIQLHINDRFGYNAEGNGKTFKTNSIQ